MSNFNRDPFFDDWERNFDKDTKRFFRLGVLGFFGVILANLVIWGVAIWAIIKLVNHFTN